MEKAMELLEALAAKLETTVEYLWAVLVQQARVEAIIDLVFIAVMMLFWVALYFWHKHCLKPIQSNSYGEDNLYEKGDGIIGAVTFFIALFVLLFTVIAIFQIPDIITGFINPEYAALKEILNTIKGGQ